MSLSSLSVKRGVTFGVIFILVLGFGLFSLSRLKLDLYPEMSMPNVLILTSYTGANPEDIENLITRTIESAVSGVEGVKKVESTSKESMSIVNVEFDWGDDMEQAETEVRRKLELVKGFLPDDANDPMVFAFDPSMQPIVMLAVSGPYSLHKLRQILEDDVSSLIERIDGVASAEVAGGLKREIHITLDPAKVEAFGLDANAIIGAVYSENLQEPGGSIEQGASDFTIHTQGKYTSVKEIGEVVVGRVQNGMNIEPLRLKDVAVIEDSFVEIRRVVEVDDKPSIWLIVRKQSGENTVKIAGDIINKLPEISKSYGDKLSFKVLFNQADFISDSVSNLSSTGAAGIFISFLVLLFFLRSFRSAIVVATAIPLSVVATFFVMDQADMTLNIISMAGLALSIGMLVDNSIVVLENIFRLRQEGVPLREAAIKGAAQVSTAVTASTLTTLSVFIPILFVPGIAGVMFKDLAVTICFALTVSLLVAISFIPLAASRLLGKVGGQAVTGKSKDLIGNLKKPYGKVLDWALVNRLKVIGAIVAVLILTGVAASLLPTEFMAGNDESMVFISIESAVSNNVNETLKVAKDVEAKIKEVVPEDLRRLLAMDVGISEGFASIFSKGLHAGSFRVPLVKINKRDISQMDIEAKLREKIKEVPGVEATVGNPFHASGSEGDIEIEIAGHDLKESRKIGLALKKRLGAMPEMAQVKYSMENQKPQLSVTFDREKMSKMGLSTASVGKAIATYFKGSIAGRYSEDGDEFDILVRYDKAYRTNVDELYRMPVATSNGSFVPLSSIATVAMELGPTSISRKNQERVTTLTCTLKTTYKDEAGDTHPKDMRAAINSVEKVIKDYPWPENFRYNTGGTAGDFIESFTALGYALLVSILLVYLVMASLFESLRQPFIILFTVPLAAIGVVLMFVLTGSTVDVSALIGVIMLIGIAVNNGIIMIDAANGFREQGLDKVNAIAQAARLRLRPVLLTSLTTIMSMVPLALEIGDGSETWSGMARSVIGGLTMATILTLIVVPVMYTLFARKTMKEETTEASA